jgi:hypothetical protein
MEPRVAVIAWKIEETRELSWSTREGMLDMVCGWGDPVNLYAEQQKGAYLSEVGVFVVKYWLSLMNV